MIIRNDMSKRKIRIFFGAYVNTTQAQALNCRALARHLDKDKFIVGARTVYSGDLPIERLPGIKLWHVRYPAKIWSRVAYFLGLLWCDVVYMPACSGWHWMWILRLLHKKAFSTVEGAFISTNMTKALALKDIAGDKRRLLWSLECAGNTYSITEAMKAVNERELGLKTKEKVLYLGVDTEGFQNDVKRERLTDVAIIGSNLFYKGLNDFFDLAKRFPPLTFHVIGSGMGKVDPKVEVEKLGLKTVVCHGSLSHTELAEVLKGIQLHIFPSRAEGFPKVTLETAAAGVPSLVYDDYGASEWIAHGESGFVVKTLDEMAGVVHRLVSEPALLQKVSDGARAMAKRFDWKLLVKDWEREIENIYYGEARA